ncbi:hypothetical protein F4778DRAFT_736796 [Xylariomycetidae sp. FL2044]|nr:hypothetical protein F4778DRAFT_736796 [Xylariomycetidae sp. FL2044]
MFERPNGRHRQTDFFTVTLAIRPYFRTTREPLLLRHQTVSIICLGHHLHLRHSPQYAPSHQVKKPGFCVSNYFSPRLRSTTNHLSIQSGFLSRSHRIYHHLHRQPLIPSRPWTQSGGAPFDPATSSPSPSHYRHPHPNTMMVIHHHHRRGTVSSCTSTRPKTLYSIASGRPLNMSVVGSRRSGVRSATRKEVSYSQQQRVQKRRRRRRTGGKTSRSILG